jgi:hypothetical protein
LTRYHQQRALGSSGVSDTVLNRFGASAAYTAVLVIDRCPGVVPLVGQRVAAGMAQHVRVRFDLQAGAGGRALDRPGEAGRGEGRSPLADENEGRRRALPLEPAQRPQLVALDRVGARGTVLDPTDVQDRTDEVDLVPTQAQTSDARGPCRKARRIIVASR